MDEGIKKIARQSLRTILPTYDFSTIGSVTVSNLPGFVPSPECPLNFCQHARQQVGVFPAQREAADEGAGLQ